MPEQMWDPKNSKLCVVCGFSRQECACKRKPKEPTPEEKALQQKIANESRMEALREQLKRLETAAIVDDAANPAENIHENDESQVSVEAEDQPRPFSAVKTGQIPVNSLNPGDIRVFVNDVVETKSGITIDLTVRVRRS